MKLHVFQWPYKEEWCLITVSTVPWRTLNRIFVQSESVETKWVRSARYDLDHPCFRHMIKYMKHRWVSRKRKLNRIRPRKKMAFLEYFVRESASIKILKKVIYLTSCMYAIFQTPPASHTVPLVHSFLEGGRQPPHSLFDQCTVWDSHMDSVLWWLLSPVMCIFWTCRVTILGSL